MKIIIKANIIGIKTVLLKGYILLMYIKRMIRKINIISFVLLHQVESGRKKLNKNINSNSNENCYVLNNPQIVKRKSFGKELVGCKVADYQDKGRIKYIANKKK